jgi:putative ABC transport system ATP-binding protein
LAATFPTMLSRASIETHKLGKRYHGGGDGCGIWAVRGVTLSVYAGDITVLMGPSGSGKTTLVCMLGGLLKPTEGFLYVCGEDIGRCGEEKRRRFRREKIGFVFQNFNLIASLTAAENVGVALSLRGRDPREAVEYLARVGLADKADFLPDQLSGGQRQCVAIARAIAGEPPVILADEPTAALDAEHGREVMGLLRMMAHERDTAVLVVTHDPRVREFADRVIEMEDGRLKKVVRRYRLIAGRRHRIGHCDVKKGGAGDGRA